MKEVLFFVDTQDHYNKGLAYRIFFDGEETESGSIDSRHDITIIMRGATVRRDSEFTELEAREYMMMFWRIR